MPTATAVLHTITLGESHRLFSFFDKQHNTKSEWLMKKNIFYILLYNKLMQIFVRLYKFVRILYHLLHFSLHSFNSAKRPICIDLLLVTHTNSQVRSEHNRFCMILCFLSPFLHLHLYKWKSVERKSVV